MQPATKYETDPTLDRLNQLLSEELAAIATYRQAAKGTPSDLRRCALSALEDEHREAAEALRGHITQLGGFSVDNAGHRTVRNEGLVELEEKAIASYEAALHEDELDPETRALIQCHLLPKSRAHLPLLDTFLRR